MPSLLARSRDGLPRQCLPAKPYGLSQFGKKDLRFPPTNTCVSNALSVDKWLPRNIVLLAFNQVTFKHGSNDSPVSGSNLLGYTAADNGLASVVFS
jgi:hypothetical protein